MNKMYINILYGLKKFKIKGVYVCMYKYRCGDMVEFLKKTGAAGEAMVFYYWSHMWTRASVIGQLWQPRPRRLSAKKRKN